MHSTRSWLLNVVGAIVIASVALAGQTGDSERAKEKAAEAKPAQHAKESPVTYKAAKVNSVELKEILSTGQNYFFLDVREPDEIAEWGTMKGSVNIPIGELEARIAEVPKDAVVITACQGGGRAGRAAAMLEKKGYTVRAVCGLREWSEKGWELFDAEGKPVKRAPKEGASAQ